MIAEINFGFASKIRGLTVEKIKTPCDCRVLKVGGPTDDYDALIDLCEIHESKFKRMQSGELEGEVLIPGLEIQRE